MQLQQYLDVFSEDQILVLVLEEFVRDKESTLRRVFDFLEIDSEFLPPNLDLRYNDGRSKRAVSGPLRLLRSLPNYRHLPWGLRKRLANVLGNDLPEKRQVFTDSIRARILDEIGSDLERFRNRFIQKGFKHVTVLHTRDRKEANSSAFTEPLKSAAGVWFSGGRQWRHADSYLDTKTHKAFLELLDRGGVIAGSSAGATIQGSYLARGDTKMNTIMMGDHEVGLGFLSNVAIDQHLFARNRLFQCYFQ